MSGQTNRSKQILLGLNIVYAIEGILLIGVAACTKDSTEITSVPIVGGIIASGIFLLCVSVFGIYATIKHNQVLLFYYMITLTVIFIIQFAVSCACLNVDKERVQKISRDAWDAADSAGQLDGIHNAESKLECCGYDEQDPRLNETATDEHWIQERQWCITNIDTCTEPLTTTTTTTTPLTTTTPTTTSTTTETESTSVTTEETTTNSNNSAITSRIWSFSIQ